MSFETSLPLEFGPLVYSLAERPAPVQELFYLVMTLLMLDDEQARLLSIEECGGQTIWNLQTVKGDCFSIVKPALGLRQEQVLMEEIFHPLDFPLT